jgi:hypothetical protein
MKGFGGAPLRRSQLGRRAPPRPAPVPFGAGDRVSWQGGRHQGVFVALAEGGKAEVLCASDGRRWRLPVSDLTRA